MYLCIYCFSQNIPGIYTHLLYMGCMQRIHKYIPTHKGLLIAIWNILSQAMHTWRARCSVSGSLRIIETNHSIIMPLYSTCRLLIRVTLLERHYWYYATESINTMFIIHRWLMTGILRMEFMINVQLFSHLYTCLHVRYHSLWHNRTTWILNFEMVYASLSLPMHMEAWLHQNALIDCTMASIENGLHKNVLILMRCSKLCYATFPSACGLTTNKRQVTTWTYLMGTFWHWYHE